MLDELIKYLRDLEIAVLGLENAYVEYYEEEVLAEDRVNLKIRIRFESGHLLELNEAVVVAKGHIAHLGYRYHFQNERDDLVFRYDNTPHFPELASFPHHKHLPAKVIEIKPPSICNVIEEAKKILA
ncbi:MAG: hypothetical protein GWP06_17810 [Actinobacteria bacterium]|nr:hypothetical protein [Actinomycetota bacterium]